MDRLTQLSNQLVENQTAGEKGKYYEPRSKNKLDWFKNNGWGYRDSQFLLQNDGSVILTGNRYQFAGEKMPKFKDWAEQVCGLNVNIHTPPQERIPADPARLNEDFMKEAEGKFNEISIDDDVRIHHSHGHTLQEMFALLFGKLERIVDCVIYVDCHQQAELLIELAMKHDVVLIPYGGGTNVTQALMCEAQEKRMIISVDVTRMNHVRWVDRKNMTALVEAGILGQDLEKELSRYGVTCGHEPDSHEFSTMGGWISTRASGMKKNRYGNIEDLVLQVKIATPIGTLTKQDYPRISSGPDLNQLVLGSEGTLGIITEAIIKVRPLPKKQVYDSILFHNFTQGTQFMYDVAQSRVWPASLRLVDNMQFQFGMALKTAPKDKKHELIDAAKKYFVTNVMKFQPDQMCLCTIVFEGDEDEISHQQKKIYALAKKHNGFRAGAENGQRAFFLTYMIAYLRDFGFQYCFFAESFETACQWKDVNKLVENVSQRIYADCKKVGVKHNPLVSFRISQVYDSGATIYVYFGFQYEGITDPVNAYCAIEDGAREEIMKQGGSISHHHGVGKLRRQFYERSVGTVGKTIVSKIKQDIDPKNIFASGNLGI